MYTREALLDWIRANAPDLRVAHVNVDGKRESFARFTWAGDVYELESAAQDAGDDVVRQAADALHIAMGRGPLFSLSVRDELTTKILQAELAGDDASVKDMTRRLVTTRAHAPTRLVAQTQFSKAKAREVW